MELMCVFMGVHDSSIQVNLILFRLKMDKPVW